MASTSAQHKIAWRTPLRAHAPTVAVHERASEHAEYRLHAGGGNPHAVQPEKRAKAERAGCDKDGLAAHERSGRPRVVDRVEERRASVRVREE